MSEDTAYFRAARKSYHDALLQSGVLCLTTRKRAKNNFPGQFPSNADGDSATSIAIAQAIFDQIQSEDSASGTERLAGQISGSKFEQITRSFVEKTFTQLGGIRPGNWSFSPEKRSIFRFEQYRHLAELAEVAEKSPEIAVLLGSDYLISPDVLVLREPETDDAINARRMLVDDSVALRSSIRFRNNRNPILHEYLL